MSAAEPLDRFLAGYLVSLGVSVRWTAEATGLSRYAIEQSAATARSDPHYLPLLRRFAELWKIVDVPAVPDAPASNDELVTLKARISNLQNSLAISGNLVQQT